MPNLFVSLKGLEIWWPAHLGRATDDIGMLLGVNHLRHAAHIVDEQRDAHHGGFGQHIWHVINHGRQHEEDAVRADGCESFVSENKGLLSAHLVGMTLLGLHLCPGMPAMGVMACTPCD